LISFRIWRFGERVAIDRWVYGVKFWICIVVLRPKFSDLATQEEGGGLWEQFSHQGLDPVSIMKKVKALKDYSVS
jgi:hypothetical protein